MDALAGMLMIAVPSILAAICIWKGYRFFLNWSEDMAEPDLVELPPLPPDTKITTAWIAETSDLIDGALVGAGMEIPERRYIFEVDDGATHWVRARHLGEALTLCADVDHESRDKYIEELGPEIRKMKDHELVTMHVEVDMHDAVRKECSSWAPKEFTIHAEARIKARACDWAANGESEILGSSEW